MERARKTLVFCGLFVHSKCMTAIHVAEAPLQTRCQSISWPLVQVLLPSLVLVWPLAIESFDLPPAVRLSLLPHLFSCSFRQSCVYCSAQEVPQDLGRTTMSPLHHGTDPDLTASTPLPACAPSGLDLSPQTAGSSNHSTLVSGQLHSSFANLIFVW